jgi:uncharacterized protein YdhG (YjbR/CyaY superfamily)
MTQPSFVYHEFEMGQPNTGWHPRKGVHSPQDVSVKAAGQGSGGSKQDSKDILYKYEDGGPHMPKKKPATVDEYIAAAPQAAQGKLREIRAVLKKVAPSARETLKWGSPVFEEGRILFSYSAHKSHLNFSPTGPALKPFQEELAKFKTGKDTIQFPYDKPLPKALIRKIAAFRAKQVRESDARWMY